MELTMRRMLAGAGLTVIGATAARGATEIEMTELPFSGTTPISVSRVGLRARDAAGLADYYKKVVGLAEISRSGGDITLGDSPMGGLRATVRVPV